jgi:hypothetical protein
MPRANLYPHEAPLGDKTIVEAEGLGDGTVTAMSLFAMFRKMEDGGSLDHQASVSEMGSVWWGWVKVHQSESVPGQLHEG